MANSVFDFDDLDPPEHVNPIWYNVYQDGDYVTYGMWQRTRECAQLAGCTLDNLIYRLKVTIK